jgi:hypothetical protein
MPSTEPSLFSSQVLQPKQMVFAALGGGVAMAAVIFASIAPVGDVEPTMIEGLFFAAAAATVVGVLTAYLIQQRVSEALAGAISGDQALEILIRRSIFSVAAVELPAMLGLVGLLLSGDWTFAAFTLPFFVVLGVLFPTADRVRQRIRSARGRG